MCHFLVDIVLARCWVYAKVVFDNGVWGRYCLEFRYCSFLYFSQKGVQNKSEPSKFKNTEISMNNIVFSHTHISITEIPIGTLTIPFSHMFVAKERQRE
jgi:hypothetical protein